MNAIRREFDGKVAFVSGASGGIGAAIVKSLAAQGAKVFATDIEWPEEPSSDAAIYNHVLDITDPAAVDVAVSKAEQHFGPIDVAASVAGVLKTGLAIETSDADWQSMFAVNSTGVFNIGRALARVMIPRKSGSIVTVSSNAGGIPRHGMSAYAASKAASTMFTRCLGLELAPHGIRCNIVAPGSTITPMLADMTGDPVAMNQLINGLPETFKTGIPLGKLGQPDDVAEAALFLLSDRASHITMADIYVDGGATQRA
ncbi:2,3-dihydro-2,3-dihydroxybenzoate dehydrogenase [Curvivirga sp.]|uniref:2,3-dihydro-2,3-dihydroxybenzoate dehydrogenase n=1 Tax=Curvivirga sp. TaxID=2856848 RepID=UPI003B58FE54